MGESESAKITCAICGAETDFFAPPMGPFCSGRCKMVDLGRWLNEEYRVSEPLSPDHFEAYAEMEGDALDIPEEDAGTR
jgi:endogenous inhibitor of DNA gyrase (YacG/DUF329 family)